MKKNMVIGILGGMGTYATLHLFKQYAEMFPAEKEWDRPRIIIDNRCTMPSRVRAFLYDEKTDELVSEMTESCRNLLNAGCTSIILDCNTSHLFLPKVTENLPELKDKVINIIETCADAVLSDGVREVYVLGTEGTMDSKVYQNVLSERSVDSRSPSGEEYHKLRSCIEAVKQNDYTESVKQTFLDLVNRYDSCILGCTELPVLYERYKDDVTCTRVYDPVYLALKKIHDEYEKGKEQ